MRFVPFRAIRVSKAALDAPLPSILDRVFKERLEQAILARAFRGEL